jgi:hypothetical protein
MSTAKGFRESKIALKKLKLWSENPRFPQAYFGKPENELIDYMVSVEHYKIKDFGQEVVEDFDMPIFEKLAIFDGDGENTAYEGNRRLATYKLLLNPYLTSNQDVQDHFIKLKRAININEEFKIDCVISDNQKEILRYVNRKHLNNNNEVAWGTIENSNARLRWLDNPDKVSIFRSNLSIIIRNLDIPNADKDKILGKGFVTTLFRVLNTNTAAKYFNLVFDDDNNLVPGNEDFFNKLEVIIYDILQGKIFNGKLFSRLTASDVDEYLKSIILFEEAVVDTRETESPIQSKDAHHGTDNVQAVLINDSKETTETETVGTTDTGTTIKDSTKGKSGAATPVKGVKIISKTTTRKYLIPKTCKLEINNNKINNIYRELRDDLVIDDSIKAVPNAVGVLFRVFLEVSLDHYAEKKAGHFFKKEDGISKKIDFVVKKMLEAGYPPKTFTNINSLGTLKKTQSYLSIEKFHEYVHSDTIEPAPGELKKKWEFLQPFFIALWDEINKGK